MWSILSYPLLIETVSLHFQTSLCADHGVVCWLTMVTDFNRYVGEYDFFSFLLAPRHLVEAHRNPLKVYVHHAFEKPEIHLFILNT